MKLVAGIVRTASLERIVCDKIEIIVSDEKAYEVEKTIVDTARKGLAGDGVVAVPPFGYAFKFRTEEKGWNDGTGTDHTST